MKTRWSERPIKKSAPALLALAALFLVGGCGPRPAVLSDPTAPPTGYQRKITVVLEREGFYPVAGAEVRIETEEPTRLVSPAGGRGRTDSSGALALIFEPPPHYDQKVLAGGDIVAEFPVKARLIVGRGGSVHRINDTQTFARYADPLYQGLNRDPEPEVTYHHIMLP